jgi:hypothetical protein
MNTPQKPMTPGNLITSKAISETQLAPNKIMTKINNANIRQNKPPTNASNSMLLI